MIGIQKFNSNKVASPVSSLLALPLIFALAACGGGGGGGSSNNPPPPPPPPPPPAVAFEITSAAAEAGGDGSNPKMVSFTWESNADEADEAVDAYRIEVNPDGSSGFTEAGAGAIAGDATSAQLELALHLTQWELARYQIVALDEDGEELDRSDEIGIADVAVEQLIGYFKASNTDAGDGFGFSLALSGDGKTLAIGAPLEASGIPGDPLDNSASSAGAVYLFSKGGDGWSQKLYIKPPDAASAQVFGLRLALSGDGDLLAVAAPWRSTGSSNGAVYLFARGGEEWMQADDQVAALVEAPDTAQGDSFGRGLALSADGGTLVVGAPSNSLSASDGGAVFIYTGAESSWNLESGGPWPRAFDGFGTSLALSADGGVLAIGIPYEDGNGSGEDDDSLADSGAVYLLSRDADAIWSPSYIKAAVPVSNEGFGGAVALSAAGDTLAVSAPFANSDTGAVYLFNNSGDGWQQQTRLTASNAGSGDLFGYGLALSADGQILAAAAPLKSTAEVPAGMAYIFSAGEAGWVENRQIIPVNPDVVHAIGYSLALSADGETLAVGAPLEDSIATGVGGDQTDNSAAGAGAVFVY